ncbi:outer membrane autotransporter [Caballeronia calidae]|uniref:Outer membrane autotransporter n=1 Tax=Caballeronia calidae TaxID=1777139 RepID=A0A158E3G3_9BURK|nr:autotransporter outer membrane beta-barrel domain-containing protein [Caballeronia calidae]SAL01313.1 outer membrane autotransporter [Caballeronia calidae]
MRRHRYREREHRHEDRQDHLFPSVVLRPLSVAVLIAFNRAAHALTTLDSSTTSQTVSTDTAYQINSGTTITTSEFNGINVEGIAPVTMSNAGSITSSFDNAAAGARFDVPGSFTNLATGTVLGHTHGIFLTGGGTADNLVNFGDVSARVSHAISYGGASSGTVDNFGTLNANASVGSTSGGVYIATTGSVVVNNHVGAVIKSGVGDATFGTGIQVDAGTATIHNDGLIDGYHVGIAGAATQPMTIVNGATGVIKGTVDAGVSLAQDSTLENHGTISSAQQPAIVLSGSNNVVTLGAGSQLSGAGNVAMTSRGSGNAIVLTGTGAQAGNFTGSASQFGFGTLTAATGSDWTLDGNVSMADNPAAAVDVQGALTLGGAVLNPAGTTTVGSTGTLTLGTGGGSGIVTGNVANDGVLRFRRRDVFTFAGRLSGGGSLVQAGSGLVTLTGAGSSQGAVSVEAGRLAFSQSGAFDAQSYTTNTGATTAISADSTLNVATSFQQAAGSTLTIGIGQTQPVITAATASLDGALAVSGFGATAPHTASTLPLTRFTILHTTGGITGDFSSVGFGGVASPVDYLTLAGAKSSNALDYTVGFGLAWLADATQGNGVFTLAGATDIFDADVPLADRAGSFASGWDGRTLTKNGAGTLVLSAANGYTGATLVNAGVLRTGVANALIDSANVDIAGGATLDFGGFTQRINNLSGAGSVTLGGATLIAQNSASTAFGGTIAGNGALVKTGSGALALGGINTYGGGTRIEAGTLVAQNGAALGSGAVINGAALQLDFARDGIVPNALAGAGVLIKTGSGAATLVAPGSAQGSVSVDAGALRFVRNGAFSTTGDYVTAAGTSTFLSGQSQLAVGNRFALDGTLNVVARAAEPAVTAASAALGANAVFNLAGLSASPTASATELANTAFTAIHTASPGALGGRFASVRVGGSASPVDYLTFTSAYTPQDFDVGLGLTWYAAHGPSPQAANGVFTLADAAGSFDMDVVLADQPANAAANWDGRTLTKAGQGTLQLSKTNTYTGATSVTGGTLAAGAPDVIANSARLTIASGATFDLRGFDQRVNDLDGAGSIALGGAALTVHSDADSVFGGVIGGAGGLGKTGTAALTLVGDNTFTGPTTIAAGTLRLGAGGTTGSVPGDIADDGVLVFDRADALVYRGTISGAGDVVQQGGGSVTLTGAHTYRGATSVDAGALLLAEGASLANSRLVTVAPGATFGGYGAVGGAVVNNGLFAVADAAPGFASGPAGQFRVGGAFTNNGEIRMSSPTPASTLTVGGNYTSNNGRLTLSTVLAGDGSATDRLVVHGDTAGQTRVKVENAGGAGAQTSNGIQIVQVDGQSNGVFTLDGRAVAGAYEYRLQQGGVTTPGDGDWYLRSSSNAPGPVPRPEPGAYLGNQQAAANMFAMTWHDRAGFADPFVVEPQGNGESTAWARTRGEHTDGNAAGGRIGESTDMALVQAGIDVLNRVSNGQRWQAGVMAGYGSATTDAAAQGNGAGARGNTNGASAGVYATWRRNARSAEGPYVDGWLQYAHFDNTVKGDALSGESYASRVWAGSIEGGFAFALGRTSTGTVLLEPELQLIYTNYHAGDHTESNGTVVQSDNGGNLSTRVGVRLFHAGASPLSPGWLPFVELNWWHDTRVASVAFNGVTVSQDGPRNRMEVKLGAQGQIAQHWRVWGDLGYQQGLGGYRSYQGLLGARYIW